MNKTLIHGGDWAGFFESYGFNALDFSANISPLGMPEGIKNAVIKSLEDAHRYPDPLCRSLVKKLSQKENVPESYCLFGNGAADLIFRLVLAKKPKNALITAPCFAEYEQALNALGCNVHRFVLIFENEFHLDETFLEQINEKTDMVFLCEPNNPTGITTKKELLMKIAERCSRVGATLLIDECFNDFLDSPEEHTMKSCLKDYKNVVILKAFTKMYAMAGIRLGYCLTSDEELIQKMQAVSQPWAVSSLAQAAGEAALFEEDYVKSVRSLIKKERFWLKERLKELGFSVVDSKANYILFRSEAELYESLKNRGILIRSCKNYCGLDKNWYRIAVKTHEENERLISAMREVCYEKG